MNPNANNLALGIRGAISLSYSIIYNRWFLYKMSWQSSKLLSSLVTSTHIHFLLTNPFFQEKAFLCGCTRCVHAEGRG